MPYHPLYGEFTKINVAFPTQMWKVFTSSLNLSCMESVTSFDSQRYGDVIMGAMASQITSFPIVYLTVYSAKIKENIKAPRHWPL